MFFSLDHISQFHIDKSQRIVILLTNTKPVNMKKVLFLLSAFSATAFMSFMPKPPQTRVITDDDAGTSYTVLKDNFDAAAANGFDDEVVRLAGPDDIFIVICPGDGVSCRILGFDVGWKKQGSSSIIIADI